MEGLFKLLDPDNDDKIDYITWCMMLNPRDLPGITASWIEIGPLALATPTEKELELMGKLYERAHTLAREASRVGTRLLIDAEQVRYQPAIDNLVLELQQTYNSVTVSDTPIIYNTYQCYLKDSLQRLTSDVERSERLNYHLGAKLVRGAYMESERELAQKLGLESPVHDTIEDTHQNYNDAVDFLLQHSVTSDKKLEIMCATHNQESVKKALEAMNRFGINGADESSTLRFGQLLSMADNLSFQLGRHGYKAYKYMPYGEIQEVIAFLLRRANENSAIVGSTSADLGMVEMELRRRIKAALFLT
jgi:proline dehydrogenase